MKQIEIGQCYQLRNCENENEYQFGKVISLTPLKLSLIGGAVRKGYIFNDTLIWLKLNNKFWSAPIPDDDETENPLQFD